jgi:hypothetical protein
MPRATYEAIVSGMGGHVRGPAPGGLVGRLRRMFTRR